MRQIVQIQIGNSGNRIGAAFVQKICQQHSIDPKGHKNQQSSIYQNLNVHFSETINSKRYLPRVVLVDLQPRTIENIQASAYAAIYKIQNMITGDQGGSNNFAKGKYSGGSQIIQNVMDALRRQIQQCDALQGFLFIHSLVGGTGSGFTALLEERIQDQFMKYINFNCSILTSNSQDLDIVTVSNYNIIHSISSMTETSSIISTYSNNSIEKINKEILKLNSPKFSDLNEFICKGLSDITCGSRFSGMRNSCLRKITTNMIPFQRLKLVSQNLSQNKIIKQSFTQNKFSKVMMDLMNPKLNLGGVDYKNGRTISCALQTRGSYSTYQIQQNTFKCQNKGSSYFVQWLPNNISQFICSTPRIGYSHSSSLLTNSSAINNTLEYFSQNFRYMFRRKSFLHWYLQQGMDEQEFIQNDESVLLTKQRYKQVQDQMIDQGLSFENM